MVQVIYSISLFVAGLCLSAGSLGASPPASGIEGVKTDEGILFTEKGQKILFYQRRPKSLDEEWERANYIHPLYSLDGTVLTEDFPKDHRHHRGLFWAWHQVWVGNRRVGDPWTTEDFSWDVTEASVQKGEGGTAILKTHVLWKSSQWTDEEGRPKPLVEEKAEIRIYPASEERRKVDFVIALRALELDMRLGGSDDEKGYGGFSARIRLPEDIRFRGTDGEVTPRRLAVDAGPWINMTGTFVEAGDPSGITMLCHPSLPEYPQPWILRRQGSMQNAAFPGREPIALSREEPLILRYRLVIHRDVVETTAIDRWQKQYIQESRPGQ